MPEPTIAGLVGPYTARQWRIAGLLFSSCVTVSVAASTFIPYADLHPEYAFALAGIFFGGIRLWPVVLFAAFFAQLVAGANAADTILIPATVLFQSVVAGYFFTQMPVDPIFRRDRDAIRLITILIVISFISPMLSALSAYTVGAQLSTQMAIYTYVSTLSVYIVLSPFILRWVAKPFFRRTWNEIVEIVGILVVLCVLNIIFFINREQSLLQFPVVYFLLVPFFFIALRLRPRFVTLAFVITATFAVASFATSSETLLLRQNLFQIELFIIALSINFLVITVLEEHRRVNATRLSTQLATLENVVTRISSESRAKNDFIAILAHELRNPLSPVISGIEILKLKNANDPEDVKTLESMSNGMQTVRTLLNDLLDVSRISEGKIALKKTKVDLEEILRRAVLSTNQHRFERHQTLALNKFRKQRFIHADPVRMEQVFSNLLTNASKYSNSGDTITVRVHEEKTDKNFIEIEVKDEGVGLEKDALEQIFEPFLQIEHGERTKEGLGIGLSLVKDFVTMHGGTVRAESEGIGRGSRFIVRLPLLGSDG